LGTTTTLTPTPTPASKLDSFKNYFEEHGAIAIALVCVLYVAIRLHFLTRYSLWVDEVFSVTAAHARWRELWIQVIDDRVHPPLYYALLKIWITIFGRSITAARMLSVTCSILTFKPLLSLTKLLRLSTSVSLLVLVVIAVNPFLIFYSQEVRMYSLLVLLSLLFLNAHLQVREAATPSRLAYWSALTSLLVLTHVAGVAVVGFAILHFSLTCSKQRSRLYLAATPPALLFVSWIAIVATHQQHATDVIANVAWISKPGFQGLLAGWGHLLGGKEFAIVLLTVVLFCLASGSKRGKNLAEEYLLAVLSLGTVAGLFAFSALVHPVWHPRYLICCVVPFYLLLGLSLEGMAAETKRFWVIVVLVWALLTLKHDFVHEADRPNFTQMISLVSSGDIKALPIFASNDVIGGSLQYALNLEASGQLVPVLKSVAPFVDRPTAYSVGQRAHLPDQALSVAPRDFFFAYDDLTGSDQHPSEKEIAPTDLESAGCLTTPLATMRGVGQTFVLFDVRCGAELTKIGD
jgi:hypothetical protein